MHNNFYFLRKLTPVLESVLKGTVLSECFSQNKDELILRFETQHDPFFIKACLLPDFCCLCFPATFNRARKNSVDLFTEIIGHKILSIRQFENERSFALEFTNNKQLLFKLHGNRSNLILYDTEKAVELFKNNLPPDRLIKLTELDRVIDWSYEHFLANQSNLKGIYFTFGKIVWQYLDNLGFNHQQSPEEKWKEFQQLKQQLENPVFYLTTLRATPHLSLIRIGNISKEINDPLKALNEFFFWHTQTIAFAREKNSLLSRTKSKLTGSEKYLTKTFNRLKEIEAENHFKVWADLIMANLHAITSGMEQIVLPNFYQNNEPLEVRLKKGLTPQKNAELYYKKSKNQQIEIEHLQKTLENKHEEIEELKSTVQHIESITDLKQLRAMDATLTKHIASEKPDRSLPYHEFDFNGYKIWIGKNAAANDELTLKYTFKDDLWLHAKDVAGSHVVVKFQAGKKIPKDVIERAAQLAAFNSKRKNESLCPVAVTAKKYVRKRKGDPPGAVVVEREDVIMVEPKQ